jgi:hypothetical protein
MILKLMIGGYGDACYVKKSGNSKGIQQICGLIWLKAKMRSTLRLIILLRISVCLPGKKPTLLITPPPKKGNSQIRHRHHH